MSDEYTKTIRSEESGEEINDSVGETDKPMSLNDIVTIEKVE